QQYAPERIERARQLMIEAQRLSAKEFSKDVVADAREAAQIAEDARVIAVRRAEEDRIARERAQEERERQAELSRTAVIAAERAQLQADRARLDAERAQAAAATAAAVPARMPEQTASADRLRTPPPADTVARANRARLAQYLRSYFETLDTPRGVVVIIPD